MKNEITPISKNIHSKYSFLPLDIKLNNFVTLSNLTECPVYLAELKYIALHFPICLTKSENNTYSIKCLMGIIGNQNVYIDNNGSWTGLYLPLSLRCLPFLIGETEEEPPKKNKLLKLMNFFATSHIAGTTEESLNYGSIDCATKLVKGAIK